MLRKIVLTSVVAIAVLVTAGCSTTLSEGGAKVTIIKPSQEEKYKCQFISEIEVKGTSSSTSVNGVRTNYSTEKSSKDAKIKLRNEAAEHGGNAVSVIENNGKGAWAHLSNTVTMKGRVLKCSMPIEQVETTDSKTDQAE